MTSLATAACKLHAAAFFSAMRTSSLWFLPLFAMAAVVVLTTAAPAQAQSSRWDVQVNNWVIQGETTPAPNNNNGALFGAYGRIYSRFDIEGSAEVATFHFAVDVYNSPSTLRIYGVSAGYDSSTLVWDNQPALGDLLGTVALSGVGNYSLDVTDYVNRSDGLSSIVIVGTAGDSYTKIVVLHSTDAPYISYTPTPNTPPAVPPVHCFDFADTTDAAGYANLIPQSGATVGELAGVVDSSIGITSTATTAAQFPALATNAGDGFTISMFARMLDEFDYYELTTSDGDWRLLVEGGVRTQVDSASGNNVWTSATGSPGWNYFAGGIDGDGNGHVQVNSNYYTDTISPPASSVATVSLSVPDEGRVDQLMIFDYALTRDEHLWLWNGGKGRPCYAFYEPTAVITYTIAIPLPTPAYTITLPSGAEGAVFINASAGELMIATTALFLAVITAISLFASYGREFGKRGSS